MITAEGPKSLNDEVQFGNFSSCLDNYDKKGQSLGCNIQCPKKHNKTEHYTSDSENSDNKSEEFHNKALKENIWTLKSMITLILQENWFWTHVTSLCQKLHLHNGPHENLSSAKYTAVPTFKVLLPQKRHDALFTSSSNYEETPKSPDFRREKRKKTAHATKMTLTII